MLMSTRYVPRLNRLVSRWYIYWHPAARNSVPSDVANTLCSTLFIEVPEARVTEIVAGGNVHVPVPFFVNANFTGTTRPFQPNTDPPSARMGGRTDA